MVTENEKTQYSAALIEQKSSLLAHWSGIRQLYNKCLRSNQFASIATAGADQVPTVTPIGTLFLNLDGTGFYFEKYTSSIRKNTKENPNLCVLAVNSGFWFWLKSLFTGKFKKYPSIKLYGKAGITREPTASEKERLYKRLKAAKGLKGYDLLWGDMSHVREIDFYHFETTKLGQMSKHAVIG